MNTKTLKENWEAYLAAYGDIATERRAQLLEQSVADDLIFTNPGGEGKFRAGLISHIEQFQRQMPGTYFTTERLFLHHNELLAVWNMHKPDGAKVATGYNFVRPGADSRFEYMAGFFGKGDPV